MIDVGLFDGSFVGNSMSLGGDNRGLGPKYINWKRNEILPITFYTDMCLELAVGHPTDIKKFALLVEPRSMSYTHYEKAIKMESIFDYILTYDRNYLTNEGYDDKWLYYPCGGSWINQEDWGSWNNQKDRTVSIIGSEKTRTRGHNLRRQVIDAMKMFPSVDVWGRSYHEMDTKIKGLRRYYYSIVIENDQIEDYFSEKLIDCISQGTVPIYWGCPHIERYFDGYGIIAVNTFDDIINTLVNTVSVEDWLMRSPAIKDNLRRITDYRCAEDWIYKNYLRAFEGR